MRLPRMTTRRWMIAVAVAAVVLGAITWYRKLSSGDREEVFVDPPVEPDPSEPK